MSTTSGDSIRRSARLSQCGRYRWSLARSWSGGNKQSVCFVMLNPSTADARQDDPTIRRCIRFARDWGYSRLVVRNLFAFRATDPKDLWQAIEPAGGRAGDRALRASLSADVIVAAWGADVPADRTIRAARIFQHHPLLCLGITANGNPRHPLYVRADREPEPYAFPEWCDDR